MRKILVIMVKELTVIARDRTALLLMIVAPLGLTAVMAFAFSGLNTGALSQIDVVVVNQDEGDLGQAFVNLLQSDALKELVNPTLGGDADAARQSVDEGKAAVALILPAELSERVMSGEGDPARIEVYGDPGRPISSGVIRGIVERFGQQVAAGALGARVTVTQLVQSGRLTLAPQSVSTAAPEIGRRVAQESVNRQLISVTNVVSGKPSEGGFNFLQYLAPGIAILFLMFSMTSSARSLLTERDSGTLARLRSTPTRAWELLGGKVAGVLATGLLQMLVLILATTWFMGVKWGEPLALSVHVFLTVSAIAAMGLVIATVARTVSQANTIGTAVVMVLAAIGGNFIPRQIYPAWMQSVSYIGPNAWGIEGFQTLAAGGTLVDLRIEVIALLVMSALFFSIAVWGFRRLVR